MTSFVESNPLTFSPAESDRFCLRVFRGGEGAALLGHHLPAALWRARADVLILRLPSSMMRSVGQLGQLGLPYSVVDGHLTFALDLTATPSPASLQNELEMTPITADRADDLGRLIDSSFDGYLNHYSANPILCDADWKSGYKDWASTVISPGAPHRKGWIVSRDGTPVGFGTFVFEDHQVRSMLYGIDPSARGGGLYTRMFRLFAAMFRADGYTTFVNSTQLDNLASQRVWTAAGSRVLNSEVTVHLNPLFGLARHVDYAPLALDTAFEATEGARLLATSYGTAKAGTAYATYRAVRSIGSTERIDLEVVTDANGSLVATTYLQSART